MMRLVFGLLLSLTLTGCAAVYVQTDPPQCDPGDCFIVNDTSCDLMAAAPNSEGCTVEDHPPIVMPPEIDSPQYDDTTNCWQQ